MVTHVPKAEVVELYHEGEHIADIFFNGMSITINPTPLYGIHVGNRLNDKLALHNLEAKNFILASFYGE